MSYFNKAKSAVIENLSTATVVHFTFDLWTSPNHRSFLGVVGHWVDADGNLHNTLLGLRRFYGAHTGANQAAYFWQVAKEFSLTKKIGYFTLDNASNNDTALVIIGNMLKGIGVSFDPIRRRLRCFGHVINLVVKAFLWGVDVDAFEQDIASYQELEKEVEELITWRKRGPMGKLHNICVWICRTPQRRDMFEEKVKQQLGHITNAKVPIVGSITRWGGDYDGLKRAFLLREPIEEFIAAAIRNNKEERDSKNLQAACLDELSHEEWDELRCIMDILEPFKKWSLKLQGKRKNGSLYDIFPAMDELLTHLENAKILYCNTGPGDSTTSSIYSQHLRTSINCGWDTLNKYVPSFQNDLIK
jgi:hypothetical protein